MEFNVVKIQRSQEPSANDDYESEKSNDEDQEDIYTERMGEEVRTDIDEESCIIGLNETKDGDEVVVMADIGTEGGVKEFQGSIHYTSASFAQI